MWSPGLRWRGGSNRKSATAYYQIRAWGELDQRWALWFDGLTITHEPNGETTLHGPVVDQVALYGLIGKARDLGLTLIAVNRVAVEGSERGHAVRS